MDRRRFLQVVSGGTAGLVVAGTSAGVLGAARPARQPAAAGTARIVIAQNPWTASALNSEIAKQLIETTLGNPTEITAIDENTMFAGLATGDLDACLEVWPSGVSADEQAYLDSGEVVNIGELGAIGQIGWFVPSYVIDEHPELATWEGFLDPELAKLFASAETGDLGRFLGTDPSYSQYDETIIANLGLPLQVVFSGSEPATFAAVESAVAAGDPILLYWWVPTAAAAHFDLVQVELPAHDPENWADDATVATAYPPDAMIKIASALLADKDPAVWSFLQQFTITSDDQMSMLPAVEIDGDDPADVAAAWIEEHVDVWEPWLNPASASSMP